MAVQVIERDKLGVLTKIGQGGQPITITNIASFWLAVDAANNVYVTDYKQVVKLAAR